MTTEEVIIPVVDEQVPRDETLFSFMHADAEYVPLHKFVTPARAINITYANIGEIGLVHQYAALCKTLFNNVSGLSAAEGIFNDTAALLLAYHDRQCLAGARIVVSTPRAARNLPCEQNGFRLQKYLPELDLYNVAYGEIVDFVALPDYHEEIMIMELLRRLVNEAVGQGVQYLFMVATQPQASRYLKMAELLGLECSLRRDVKLPEYDELAGGQAVLTILDLTMAEPTGI